MPLLRRHSLWTACHYTKSQNLIISFGYVDSYAKIFLILCPPLENSATRTAIGEGKEGEGVVNVLHDWYKYFEPLEKDEKNIVSIDITEDMAPKDVMKSVLKILEDKNATVTQAEVWPRRMKSQF